MSEIQDIKERVVLSEIIGRHVKLTPAGAYQRGLCPFHHEKTPSFHVNDALGFYKCFGCGEGGDVFTFLEKYEGMTFREALETLAAQTGVTLTARHQSQQDRQRVRVLEILAAAADYYQKNLTAPVGQAAREYLVTRGTNQFLIDLFKIGASGHDWQGLTNYLKTQKYTDQELVASGLVRANQTGRLYDAFRDRLMFPLRDHRGRVVGFSGRQLVANPHEGKYINTPETIVYHKGKMLYGLHEFNQSIRQHKQMLIVEGEFDLLSSAGAGVDWVCAIKGSALTEDHAQLIARYTDKVLLSLDSDAAGIKATKKAIAVLRPHEVELRVVMLTAGQDPDEQARANPAAWRDKVKTAVSVWDFFLTTIINSHDIHSIDGQKKILQEMGEIFTLIDNRLEYEFYLKKLAQQLGQDLAVVRDDIKQWGQLATAKKAPVAAPPPATTAAPKRQLTKLQRLEAYLWFLFIQCLTTGENIAPASKYVTTTTWHNSFLQKLAANYETFYRQHPQPTLKEWYQTLPEDFAQKVAQLSLNKAFIKLASKTVLTTEWAKQTTAHQQEVAHQATLAYSRELAQLDKIDDPTLEQEQRKNELLQKIVNLRQKGT